MARARNIYVQKPYLQTSRTVKLAVLLGSSTTQWRKDCQDALQNAVKTVTNRFVKMEIQPKLFVHKNDDNVEARIPILQINVAQEHAEVAEEGLCKVLAKGAPSPVGRKMFFISLRDRTRNGKNRLQQALGRQRELNEMEKTTATNILQDIRQEVLSADFKKYTIQQIICSLTDPYGKKIFTGAERLG